VRKFDEQRNAQGALVERRAVVEMLVMVVKLFAVVGRDDDEGVIPEAQALEVVETLLQEGVRIEERAFIEQTDGRDLLGSGGRFPLHHPVRVQPFMDIARVVAGENLHDPLGGWYWSWQPMR